MVRRVLHQHLRVGDIVVTEEGDPMFRVTRGPILARTPHTQIFHVEDLCGEFPSRQVAMRDNWPWYVAGDGPTAPPSMKEIVLRVRQHISPNGIIAGLRRDVRAEDHERLLFLIEEGHASVACIEVLDGVIVSENADWLANGLVNVGRPIWNF